MSILVFHEPGNAALRDEYLHQHFDYLKSYDDKTLFAGPFAMDDEAADLGSLRLIDLPDVGPAEKHIADEPYVTGGVQKRWQINGWKPESAEIRASNQNAHKAYLDACCNSIVCRGSILSDYGDDVISSFLLSDIEDMAAARAIIDDEPLFKAGCYEHVEFHRWRFDRVFDRYK